MIGQRVMVIALAAVAAMGTSCKKQSSGNGPAGGGTIAASSTDPLWALAPADLRVGVVIADGAGPSLLAAARTALESLEELPAGKEVVSRIRSEMKNGPVNPLDDASIRAAGIDVAKGTAVFFTERGFVWVLPVADRTKVVEILGGQVRDGVDDFVFVQCKELSKRYVCASDPATFETLASGTSKVADWPKHLRGHIEVFVAPEQIPEDPALAATKGLRAAVTLERGAFTARAHLVGTPSESLASVRSQPSALTKSLADVKPSGLFVLNAGAVWNTMKGDLLPHADMPLPGGVTLADVLTTLTGSAAGYSLHGEPYRGFLRLGVSDTGPIDTLLGQCAELAPSMPPGFTLEASGKACRLTIDPAKLGVPNGATATIDLFTEKGAVVLGIGDYKAKGKQAAPELPAFAKDILSEQPIYGAWGHGWYGAMAAQQTATLPVGALDSMEAISLWVIPHIVEFGAWADVRDDGLHGGLRVRTTWANPKALVKALDPHMAKFASGDMTALSKASALAKQHKGSHFTADVEAGPGGLMAPVTLVGIVAAIAVPAFIKYTSKSKSSEARVMLHRLSTGATLAADAASASADGTVDLRVPDQAVGPTPPPGSCCMLGLDGQCAPDASLWQHPTWQALNFSLDDPHYYAYQYIPGPDGKSYTVRAIGDLDCDGHYSTFELTGRIDRDPQATDRPEIQITDELE